MWKGRRARREDARMHRYALPAMLLAVSVGLAGCVPEPSISGTPTSATQSPNPPESPSPTDGTTSGSTDLAGSAVVTASSEDTAAGHLAANATDGDPTTEWASGAGVGSTILLEWDTPQELGSIVLSDRPNPDDHVVAGTLEFSDGSTALVPTLPNDGQPVRIDVTPRQVTSVRFTVDEVGPYTTDVGLSEIGAAPPQAIASLLGTERIFADAGGVVSILPRAVASVDETDGIRLIRVELEIGVLAGTVVPTQSWFAILGADGSRYPPVDDPADEYADPINEAALGAGESLTGTVHFELPSDGSGFLIGFVPDPAAGPTATWSLNAP